MKIKVIYGVLFLQLTLSGCRAQGVRQGKLTTNSLKFALSSICTIYLRMLDDARITTVEYNHCEERVQPEYQSLNDQSVYTYDYTATPK